MTQPAPCIPCKAFVILLALLWTGAAAAAPAPCAGEAYRAFDFWLGSWEVKTPAGELAGHNEISAHHGGCLLEERWQGASGSTGTSLNFFDPATGRWRQLWVSEGAVIDIEGGLEEGAMVLVGTITYAADPAPRAFRGAWTPLPDGRVRQRFEEQDAEGRWVLWFEGLYAKAVN